jgi:hypothetical protein
MRCECRTQSGRVCQNSAVRFSSLCSVHQNCANQLPRRNTAMCLCVIGGRYCRNRPLNNGSRLCYLHQNCANLRQPGILEFTEAERQQWLEDSERTYQESLRRHDEEFYLRAVEGQQGRVVQEEVVQNPRNLGPLRHLDLRYEDDNSDYSCKYAELLPQGIYCSNAQCPVTMSDLDATNTAAFVCQGNTGAQTVLCYNMYFLFDYFMRERRTNPRQLPSLPDNRQVVALPDRIRLGIRVLSAIINGNVIGEDDIDNARPIVDELGDEIREVLTAYQNALAAYLESQQ